MVYHKACSDFYYWRFICWEHLHQLISHFLCCGCWGCLPACHLASPQFNSTALNDGWAGFCLKPTFDQLACCQVIPLWHSYSNRDTCLVCEVPMWMSSVHFTAMFMVMNVLNIASYTTCDFLVSENIFILTGTCKLTAESYIQYVCVWLWVLVHWWIPVCYTGSLSYYNVIIQRYIRMQW